MTPVFRLFERWIDPYRDGPPITGTETPFAMFLMFVRQAKWPFVLMLLVGGAMAGLEAALYSFIGWIVDLLDTNARETFFQDNLWLLLLMAFVILVVRVIVVALSALTEEQTVVPGFFNLVRWQSHQHVMRQSLSFFQDEFAGRLAAKVWQAGMASGDFMNSLLQTVWYILVYALTTMVMVGRLDWVLGAIIALWLAIYAVMSRYFIPRVRQRAKELAHAGSGVSGRFVDTYSNIQTVKLFSTLEGENRGVRQTYDRFLDRLMDFTRMLTIVRISNGVLSGAMIVLIAAFSLVFWQTGQLSTGEVAFTLGLTLRLNLLLNRMQGQLNGLFRSYGTFQDSMDTIVRPVAVQDQPEAAALKVEKGAVRFEGVRFHYGKAGGVIDHLDLSIRAGERVGLVGPSGAGKSTLVSLLLRFHDVEAGRILIDGQDIREVSQASLRAQIGMVAQDTSLLHRSIRENILFGKPGASEDEMREAARRAHALGFIESLVDAKGRKGFDAQVGERGVKLSGGQRQRIAIARVLLKNAPILVLDEATSALDSEVEAAIQENLAELMTGKTVIAIAHRLSTIAAMDRLLVMDGGAMVQDGPHDALLEDREGLYSQLWERQSGGFLDREE
ncbi:ABC transporter ATP-binding protein [Roseibium suaedae]|uniref:ATP-binding cassette, subfamily B, multidrug efflux pump n=1 Tax=Roseibium suaedae TaxID=735517 RepID=A0A1M7HST7_9HYPH|nr:ABC transporter ATP-binding protein [Roseibium suaedae]SHM31403.1 ATP-binding cassette, subfamily B, multidrug efflux pump [Roseibium suaedae]